MEISTAYIAYPGQPQVVMLRDADLDKTPQAETITLTISARYKVEAKEAAETDDLLDIFASRMRKRMHGRARQHHHHLEERLKLDSTATEIRTYFRGR